MFMFLPDALSLIRRKKNVPIKLNVRDLLFWGDKLTGDLTWTAWPT